MWGLRIEGGKVTVGVGAKKGRDNENSIFALDKGGFQGM